MDLCLLIGLNGPIDCIHPGKEHRHRRQELFFQKGDLSFPVGVIHPGPGDQHSTGGVGGEDPFDCPVAGLHQTNGISRGITESLGSHNQTDAFRRSDGTHPERPRQARGDICCQSAVNTGSAGVIAPDQATNSPRVSPCQGAILERPGAQPSAASKGAVACIPRFGPPGGDEAHCRQPC